MNMHLTDDIAEIDQKLELLERQKQCDSEIKASRSEIELLQEKLDLADSQLKDNCKAKYRYVYNIVAWENNRRIDIHTLVRMMKSMLMGNHESAWGAILAIFDEEFPGYSDAIMDKYPDLTDTEYKMAIFSFLDFTAKEVSLLLGKKVSTIHSARSDLRKKLQMNEKGGDIKDFLVGSLP